MTENNRERWPGAVSDAPLAADAEAEADDAPSLVRHEEELELGAEERVYGGVRARKRVETERVERLESRSIEHGEAERAPAAEGDSGEIETLDDGSVSIPLFEERLVVRKELVVRERVIIRKHTVTEQHRIEAELRKEQIEIEGDIEPEEDRHDDTRV
jgi:uncharacterized protein (TIGR02271 family)